ncbi:DUF4215 domain-containing protein [Myxococcota bacterium]|nr:DUF4215 domain-containing protein [Myxococcota bacterium]
MTLKPWIFLVGLSSIAFFSSCKVDPKTVDACGDGIVDPGEECDQGEFGGVTCNALGFYGDDGILSCGADCAFDVSGCGSFCGDGEVDTAYAEDCDGTNLNGSSCTSLGAVGGVLRCSEGCRYDLSECTSICGNGRVENEEACDDGDTAGGDGCSSACALEAGFDCTLTNPTVCTAICGDGLLVGDEPCDGDLFGGKTCSSEGFYSGTLSCDSDCRLDTRSCEGLCGDGLLQEGHEDCDGVNLNAQTCTTQGFYQGTLRCGAGCTFDVSGCGSFCGDGVIDGTYGEVCDGLALAGNTCTGLGYHGGTLACLADCSDLDTASCVSVGSCGDGTIQTAFGEQCDGANLDGQDCGDFGHHGTGLSCDGTCQFDLTACEANGRCGDGTIQTAFGEQCDGANLDGQDCGDFGHHGTGLSCDGTCQFDLTACEANGACGDGVVQTAFGEQCDGTELGGQDCATLLFYGSGLFCDSGCLHDWSVCVANGTCGDGVVQTAFGEQCDGADLDSQTCRSRGFFTGELACTAGCAFGPCRNVVNLGVGGSHACVVLDDTTVKCWGRNEAGQCGDGTLVHRSTPVTVVGLTGAARVDGASNHTCAVMTDGTARCWGYNYVGYTLGDAVGTVTVNVPNPVTVVGLTGAVDVTVGGFATCVLKSDATVACWGMNGYGQLGDGTTVNRQRPQTTVSGLTGVVQVDAGYNFFCARDSAGEIWCWGRNDFGQLGDGTTTDRTAPVQVPGISGALHLSCGENHACAVLADGTVNCWGKNDAGQLGNGTTTNSSVPVSVPGLTGATAVTGANLHTCVRLTDGTARCWGANYSGHLGNGTTTASLIPVTVSGLAGVLQIANTFDVTCALVDGATVRCWGNNYYGQCGDGTTTNRTVPVRVLP